MIESRSVLPRSDALAKTDRAWATEPTDNPEDTVENLSLVANIKMGLFHIGSALGDILGSGVWNRIMIADLGYPATPVSLLLALNYFLSPLAIWTGQRSDHTNWRGYRRLPWILGGRSLMAVGFLLLAFATFELAETRQNSWWLLIFLAFSCISLGYVGSGSAYTTLIYERAPEAQRGRAVGVVWTMLLGGYAFAGVLFSRLLPHYTPAGLLTLFIVTTALILSLWFFAVWNVERPRMRGFNQAENQSQKEAVNFVSDLKKVWSKKSTRWFFLYIGISFMAVFAQDQVLEPFGGQVFEMSAGETSRFAAYWGSTALLGSIVALGLHRRLPMMTYARINRIGLGVLACTFVLLTLAAISENSAFIRPTLILFGIGLGLWNIGAWGLMVAVSSAAYAGTYFGLWTMASLIFRGGGSVTGAVLRDTGVALTGSLNFAYGIVFALEALAIVGALVLLNRLSFGEEQHEPAENTVLTAVAAEA